MSRSCLVIQEARFGDLIQSKPLIDRLSMNNYRTTVLVRPGVIEAARVMGIGDEILSWPSFGDPGSDQSVLARLAGAREFVRILRARAFDKVIVMNNHGTGIMLGHLLSAPVAGFTRLFNSDEDPQRGGALSGWPGYLVASSRGIRSLNRIHLSDMWLGFDGSIKSKHPRESKQGGSSQGPVVFVLGGRSPYRRWEAGAILSFIRALRRIDGGKVVLSGTAEDQDLGSFLEREAGEGVINLSGKTGIEELSSLIDSASVVVSPDTAPLHLAAMKGVPTVGIFFASALSFETGAYHDGSLSIVTSMECYPCAGEGSSCSHRSCRDNPGPEVVAEIVAMVKRGGRGEELSRALGDRAEGSELWEGLSSESGFLQRVLTPRILTRERLLARLLRRFYWRYLEQEERLPSLSSELAMEGRAPSSKRLNVGGGALPDPLWMVRLERGVSLYAGLRERGIEGPHRLRMVDRLASEFPMIWPILHHLEWVEGSQGNVPALIKASEGFIREIREAARLTHLSIDLIMERQTKEGTHVAI